MAAAAVDGTVELAAASTAASVATSAIAAELKVQAAKATID